MAKNFAGGFPGGGAAADKSPVAEEFEPGTVPVEVPDLSATPPDLEDFDLPMIPVVDSVVSSEFQEEQDFPGQTPGFLDELLF